MGTRRTGGLHLPACARRRAFVSDLDREIGKRAAEQGWQATPAGFALTSEDRAWLENRAQELRIHWRLESRTVKNLKDHLKNLPLSAWSASFGNPRLEPFRCQSSPPFPVFVTRWRRS